MTPPATTTDDIGLRFMLLGLLALAASLAFGALGAVKFLDPDFLEALPFHKVRPLHVSLAVSWIFLAAIGGIYHHLHKGGGPALFSPRAAAWHFRLFAVTGIAILGAYLAGRFGGREYWEFPPVLSLPIFASWILFGWNYFRSVLRRRGAWPVYYWMWGTGIVFFLITFSEAHLWLIPFFRENMVREVTVQWKAYGALVGSWNMLVYGTAILVMEKISGDETLAASKLAFSLFFLGLFNLMFGWAHHAYPVPAAPWIRHFAYVVSMTELLVLGKIIWDWRGTVATWRRFRHRDACRFLFAADLWVFLNLLLAIVISIPAANLFTHGTHVTVAHAMGTTIGINTMILLASVFYVIETRASEAAARRYRTAVRAGFWLTNGALLAFFLALIGAGLVRGTFAGSFAEMTAAVAPWLVVFTVAGVGLMAGLWMILLPATRTIWGLVAPRRRAIAPSAAE